MIIMTYRHRISWGGTKNHREASWKLESLSYPIIELELSIELPLDL
jgi:hypothetical protein